MSVSQLPLPLVQFHHNQHLFSDYYLNTLLPARTDWQALLTESAAALQTIARIYAAFTPSPNEAQTEDGLIKPVLTALGHTYEVQAALKTPDGTKKPDYIFYRDQRTRNAQKGQTLDDRLPQQGAIAVGDAKFWERPLDMLLKGKSGDPFSNKNPSFQIAFYMQHSAVVWGMLTNGRRWRLYHQDTAHKLDHFYEVDLPELLERNDPAAFLYFYVFFRRAAFDEHPLGLRALLQASSTFARGISDNLKQQVYNALRHLAQGLLDYAPNQLQPDAATLKLIYDHGLILLYRILFILYAEARDLLPLRTSEPYRDFYSLEAIKREVAGRVSRGIGLLPGSATFWPRLQELFGIINAGNPLLKVATFNGGLFDPSRYPFLETYSIGDAHLLQAIDMLARVDGMFIDYRDLAERHLGTIYEGLLEYHLEAIAPEDGFTIALLNDKGERRSTGSYYTPDYIVKFIVDQTVGPVLRQTVAGRAHDADRVAAVLAVNVCDPAMGSGHFLVEATEYIARFLVDQALPPLRDASAPAGDAPEPDLTYWKRRVAQNCIYGVDLNPLAVELAKLSLWLATVAQDRPLSFLDHHLRCGNALIGARIADLNIGRSNTKHRQRREKTQNAATQLSMLDNDAFRQSMSSAVDSMWLIEGKAGDTVADVKEQEQLYANLRANLTRKYGRLANLTTATHFGVNIPPDLHTALTDYATGRGFTSVPPVVALLEQADTLSSTHRFFHWELEFPEVFFDRHGYPLGEAGFDAVVGNPPYGALGDAFSTHYMKRTFRALSNQDVFTAFLEAGFQQLKQAGYLGYILPASWQTGSGYVPMREFALSATKPIVFIGLPFNTFPDAYVDAGVYVFQKDLLKNNHTVLCYTFPKQHMELTTLDGLTYAEITISAWLEDEQKRIVFNNNFLNVKQKIALLPHIIINDICESGRGVLYADTDVIEASSELLFSFKPFFGGSYARYETIPAIDKWIHFGDQLKERPRDYSIFQGDRVMIRRIVSRQNRLMATMDERDFVVTKDVYIFKPRQDVAIGAGFLVSLLNSKLFSYLYLSQDTIAVKDDFRQITLTGVRELPIRRISFTTPATKRATLREQGIAFYNAEEHTALLTFCQERLTAQPEQSDVIHDILSYLAQQMLALHRQRQSAVEDLLLDLEGVLTPDQLNKLSRLYTPPRPPKNDNKDVAAKQAKYQDALSNAQTHLGTLAERRLELRDNIGEISEAQWKWLLKGRLKNPLGNLSDLVKIYRRHQPAIAALDRRIASTDCLIDQIVYALYDLNDAEIALVETHYSASHDEG